MSTPRASAVERLERHLLHSLKCPSPGAPCTCPHFADLALIALDAAPAPPADVEAALKTWWARFPEMPRPLPGEWTDLLTTVTALVAAAGAHADMETVPYKEWMRRVDAAVARERERCAQIARDLKHRPYEIAKRIRQEPGQWDSEANP